MLVQQKIGNLSSFNAGSRNVDLLPIEWYEANKRILHKRTREGRNIVMKFLRENQNLIQDDIIYQDDNTLIVIDILPCDAIVIRPENSYQLASVCYEIGNKHLPLFFQNDELLVAYELPLLRLLLASGYCVKQEKRKLTYPLKTTVTPHGESSSGESLFSKIMKLTNQS